jgi:hypothetical protein
VDGDQVSEMKRLLLRTDLDSLLISGVDDIRDDGTSAEGDTISSVTDLHLVQASEIDDNVFVLDIECRWPTMTASLSKKVKIVLNTVFHLVRLSDSRDGLEMGSANSFLYIHLLGNVDHCSWFGGMIFAPSRRSRRVMDYRSSGGQLRSKLCVYLTVIFIAGQW